MTRRTVIAMLWFLAFALASEVLWSIGITPRPVGLVVATAVAGFVWLDPMGQLHPRRGADPEPVRSSGEAQLVPQ